METRTVKKYMIPVIYTLRFYREIDAKSWGEAVGIAEDMIRDGRIQPTINDEKLEIIKDFLMVDYVDSKNEFFSENRGFDSEQKSGTVAKYKVPIVYTVRFYEEVESESKDDAFFIVRSVIDDNKIRPFIPDGEELVDGSLMVHTDAYDFKDNDKESSQ